MKKLLILLAALAACSKPAEPSGASGGGGKGAGMNKIKVTFVPAELRDIDYRVDTTGSIEAYESIKIPAQVGGVIEKITEDFVEGKLVGKGTVLAEIDIQKYELALKKAQADFDRAEAQSHLAETIFKNRENLYNEGKKQGRDFVTDEQLATFKADSLKAKADRDKFEADLDLAKRNLRDAQVKPPVAGIINEKLVAGGEFVKGETVIATILNVEKLYVRFTVPELEASKLRKDLEISFRIRSEPDNEFKAKIFFVSQQADAASRTVLCKALVEGKHEQIKPGYLANITIVTKSVSSVVVYERSVQPTAKGFIVYLLDGSRAKMQPVKLGLRSDGMVEILQGLKKDDKYIVDGAGNSRDGMEVDAEPLVEKKEK